MRVRPILFSLPMVKALLSGTKTQTRRVVLSEHLRGSTPVSEVLNDRTLKEAPALCPYGQPGDRLWVRETCWLWGRWKKAGTKKNGRQAFKFEATETRVKYQDNPPGHSLLLNSQPRGRKIFGWAKRPSIFMPVWASRICLEVVSVRVERLQDITEEDAMAEGMNDVEFPARVNYESLWNEINADRGYCWSKNPFVWVITFKRIKP